MQFVILLTSLAVVAVSFFSARIMLASFCQALAVPANVIRTGFKETATKGYRGAMLFLLLMAATASGLSCWFHLGKSVVAVAVSLVAALVVGAAVHYLWENSSLLASTQLERRLLPLHGWLWFLLLFFLGFAFPSVASLSETSSLLRCAPPFILWGVLCMWQVFRLSWNFGYTECMGLAMDGPRCTIEEEQQDGEVPPHDDLRLMWDDGSFLLLADVSRPSEYRSVLVRREALCRARFSAPVNADAPDGPTYREFRWIVHFFPLPLCLGYTVELLRRGAGVILVCRALVRTVFAPGALWRLADEVKENTGQS